MPQIVPQKKPVEWLSEPPEGLWYETREGSKKPFVVRWRASDGKRPNRRFPTAEDRAKFAGAWLKQRKQFGEAVELVDARTVALWAEFRQLAGEVHPLTIVREWLAWKGGGSHAITVADAVMKYLAFRYGGKLSPDTKRHFDKHLKERFSGHFGDKLLRDITDEMVSLWLKGLRHPRTKKPMEAVTQRHHRKDLNTFFDYCARVKRWIPHNPCEGVPVPAVEEKDVKLLTVEEGQRLFAANEGQRVVGRMAFEAFGFLRASSAGRISQEDIRFGSRGVRMPGAEHKSSKTKFRQGHPDNLWAWLIRAPDETWEMKWWEYRNEKAKAFVRAGIEEGSANRLRTTCISAHLAWQKNPPLTSYLAQHRHSSTTEIYHGMMEEGDAAEWFRIHPNFIF